MSERQLTYGEAVREAIAKEMRRDPRVFLLGEDVAESGHARVLSRSQHRACAAAPRVSRLVGMARGSE